MRDLPPQRIPFGLLLGSKTRLLVEGDAQAPAESLGKTRDRPRLEQEF
jgi:hypothetical protein